MMLPFVNSYLVDGFPLPSAPHVKLYNASLHFANEFMFIATDFAIN